jgi:hypothetical protein
MLKNPSLFLIVLILLVTACTQQVVKPLQILSQQPLPALAVEYETTVIASDDADQVPQTYRWRFYRAVNRVETHKLQDNSGEIWSRFADGSLSYQRVFHAQQEIIDYVPGDLKAIGISIDWLALSTLLEPGELENLVSDSREEFLGRPAVHYKNSDLDQPVEIIWLEQEQLPALIQRTEQGRTFISRIIAISALHQAPWLPPDSSDYRLTDFADLGDKENDVFINQILPKLKGSHSHVH